MSLKCPTVSQRHEAKHFYSYAGKKELAGSCGETAHNVSHAQGHREGTRF